MHDSVQVRVRAEHEPEHVSALVSPGLHSPSPVHAVGSSQKHESLQVRVCVPQLPHESVSTVPAAHIPSPLHSDQASHSQASVQVRVRVPQLPQSPVSVSPGSQRGLAWHSPSLHAPQRQLASHVRVRSRDVQSPHETRSLSVAPGSHAHPASGGTCPSMRIDESSPPPSHIALTQIAPGGQSAEVTHSPTCELLQPSASAATEMARRKRRMKPSTWKR